MNNKFYNTGVCGADQLSTTDIAISSNFTMNITFSIIFAALMAISANSFIYLPFTPIPVTTGIHSTGFRSPAGKQVGAYQSDIIYNYWSCRASCF